MLVLSRHIDESLIITTPKGEKIVVTVVDIRGNKARLGITADPSISIHREEIQDKINKGSHSPKRD